MSIDPYAPCPCGSGKKLKFCCSDLAGDIEKIEKLIRGEQPHAALRHVQRLLEKQPERASLLDMRASLELSLDELDNARETIQQYLQLHPENPSAYGQAAILAAAKGETAAAVGALQAAMERLEGERLPLRLYEALGSVGHGLLLAGDLVAARAHLSYYAAVAPEGDRRGFDLLMRLNLEGRPPLVLREQFRLAEPPEEASWKSDLAAANQSANRGRWQRAEAEYVELLERVGAEAAPQVVYNLAVVRGWLGDSPRFAAGMRDYASLDVPWENAVEALALAEIVDPAEEETIETTEQRFAIADAESVYEKLLTERRAVESEPDAEQTHEDDGPPRAEFVLIDRPPLVSIDDVEPDDVPNVVGLVAIWGKRTDRDAVLALVAAEGSDRDKALEVIQEALGDDLGDELRTQVVSEMPRSAAVLQWRWHLPQRADVAQRQRLHDARRRQVILEQWGKTPLGMLAGRTPLEAAADPTQQLAVAAAVFCLELGATQDDDAEVARQLREQLNLPVLDAIEPDQVDVMQVPLGRVHRLNFRALADDRIEPLFARLLMSGADLAVRRMAIEMVRRVEEEDSDLDASQAYRELFDSTTSPSEALNWARRGRAWAEKHGQSTAEWGLRELQLQLELGSPEGIRSALAYLQTRHGKDPQVGEQIYRLLYAAGLGPMLEEMRNAADAAPGDAAASEPAIWTPDAPSAAPTEKGSSAIWTP